MFKLLKTKWSGRVDSNHRPPGPEPWESLFCRLLEVFADSPYRAVFFIFSMASSVFALHRPTCSGLPPLAARKGQEKGKVDQVLDSWFTHQLATRASRCSRTS